MPQPPQLNDSPKFQLSTGVCFDGIHFCDLHQLIAFPCDQPTRR